MAHELPIVEASSDTFIGREPSWIVSSGITLISVSFILLVLISWLIKFPETVDSTITITTPTPPIDIVSKVDAQILVLFVENNEEVSKGQPLLLLESTTEYGQLQALEAQLPNVKRYIENPKANPFDITRLNIVGLGTLHSYLDELIFSLRESTLITASRLAFNRTNKVIELSQQYQHLKKQLKSKKDIWVQKAVLEKSKLDSKRLLFAQGVMTDAEIQPLENSYLNTQLTINDIDIKMDLYDVEIKELEEDLAEFKILQQEKQQLLLAKVYTNYVSLITAINDWKKRYLIAAPYDGTVSFHAFWGTRQNVKKGDVLITLIKGNTNVIGKLYISSTGSGKISTGQNVKIELDDYPVTEYGILEGTVNSKSLISGNKGYLIDVTIPQDMLTSHKKHIPFTSKLNGNASIIIDDKRLLERFLEKIIHVFGD